MATIWKGRTGTQSDRGFVTDEAGLILGDNTGNNILFHTGIFVKTTTQWTNARQ